MLVAIPEPPDVTHLVFVPTEETQHLSVLTASSAYSPPLPKTIFSHPEFGMGKEFLIDGFIDDIVRSSNPPSIVFLDAGMNAILRLTFDISFALLKIASDFTVSLFRFFFH